MGLRFRKSIKIAPGVKINLNKKSTSVTFGSKGVHYTASSTGKKTASVGIPGTGISYTKNNWPIKQTKENQRRRISTYAYSTSIKFSGSRS